jgi:hypothetical protein
MQPWLAVGTLERKKCETFCLAIKQEDIWQDDEVLSSLHSGLQQSE